MKRPAFPDADTLRKTGRPFLSLEISAARDLIEYGRSKGYSIKEIWRSLSESGDITSTYNGFRLAYRRILDSHENTDDINKRSERIPTRGTKSERESATALAEAREVLAQRTREKSDKKSNI